MKNNVVTIKCYGIETKKKRNDAIREFLEAIACCEGAERDRYMNVYLDLISGKNYCTDGD